MTGKILYQYQASEVESLSQAVLSALIEVEEIDTEQTLLYDVIDPDALNGLFNHESQKGSVLFRYAGHPVKVTSDGRIFIYEQPTS